MRRPAAWSTPFSIEDGDEGKGYSILPGVGEVANRAIDCERHCTLDGDAGGLGPQSVGSRRMGVDQLNRYGLRDLLRMLRVSDDRA